jgi:hypothetical protein
VWKTSPAQVARTTGGTRPRGSSLGHQKTSFFCAYEVSCRVRAERVKPYAPLCERFTPRTCARSEVGPPPPGATQGFGV